MIESLSIQVKMKLFACITIQIVFFQIFLGYGSSLPQSPKPFFMDIAEFDDKNQHDLAPTSLISGVIGLVAEKTHEHVLSKRKDAIVGASAATVPETDSELPNSTTSKRPTMIDFMSKFKTKRSIDANKDDYDCSGKISMAEFIAEHGVEKNVDKKIDGIVVPEHELEEAVSGGINERSKRSNKDDADHPIPSSCGTKCCSFFPSPQPQQQPEQPQSTCSTGTCDRIET